MNYKLVHEVVELVHQFETENKNKMNYSSDLTGFKEWVATSSEGRYSAKEPYWKGKENGRSAESVINTLIVHMNRYAKSYSKSAISDSVFSTQEDFIYLTTLKSFGAMPKMELIKENVHEKPAGIQIINRLIHHGWAEQTDSETDKRIKVIKITEKGLQALDDQMHKIRKASQIVTGALTYFEKLELIRLLSKLNEFHHSIYRKNLQSKDLLDAAYDYLQN
ncbi:MAG: MarR family winged helix-turn-helix transcriptional regulator [Chryseobacterium sp.]|uniref:MarR family winged helix-turn-helix transcriptional regulator n=1 Tax=Chryseobacterium sp. TaxID=1871047 RepID=UPI0025BE5C52|nr:MarR family winged helix-turn-helix transcriptional regulator [Chryseobacterium sp.]MCJ7932295.1 MarR family winged helix-turn-helix transcriptional regulator [Chryseobacterium sp.]